MMRFKKIQLLLLFPVLSAFSGLYVQATNEDVIHVLAMPIDKYRPEKVSEAEAEVALEAAHAAVRKPFKITKIKVQKEDPAYQE